ISGGRLLTHRVIGSTDGGEGPVELWDTASGRLVAGLDGPERNVQRFRFLNGGQWVTTFEGNSTVLVFSAEDGRQGGRLNHPAGETVHDVEASPSGRRIATVSTGAAGESLVRTWDTNSWKADSTPVPIKNANSGIGLGSHF